MASLGPPRIPYGFRVDSIVLISICSWKHHSRFEAVWPRALPWPKCTLGPKKKGGEKEKKEEESEEEEEETEQIIVFHISFVYLI